MAVILSRCVRVCVCVCVCVCVWGGGGGGGGGGGDDGIMRVGSLQCDWGT